MESLTEIIYMLKNTRVVFPFSAVRLITDATLVELFKCDH